MLFAGNPASAAVDARRSRSAGGVPPRSPARSFVPNRVVLRRGRVAVPGASLGRGSRARLKREPDSRGSSFIELYASSVYDRNFVIRSFLLPRQLAERICRWRSSPEVAVHIDDRHDCADGQFYGILNLPSVPFICRAVRLEDGQEGPAEGAQAQQRWRCSLGQQAFTHRCRCACSHALLAARTPFPPRSAAFMHPLPRRCLGYGHCSRSRCFGRRDGDC
jgi:hypothetical protein